MTDQGASVEVTTTTPAASFLDNADPGDEADIDAEAAAAGSVKRKHKLPASLRAAGAKSSSSSSSSKKKKKAKRSSSSSSSDKEEHGQKEILIPHRDVISSSATASTTCTTISGVVVHDEEVNTGGGVFITDTAAESGKGKIRVSTSSRVSFADEHRSRSRSRSKSPSRSTSKSSSRSRSPLLPTVEEQSKCGGLFKDFTVVGFLLKTLLPLALASGFCLRANIFSLVYLLSFFWIVGVPRSSYRTRTCARVVTIGHLFLLLIISTCSLIGQLIWNVTEMPDTNAAQLFGFVEFDGVAMACQHLVPDILVFIISAVILALMVSRLSRMPTAKTSLPLWRVYFIFAMLLFAALFVPCVLNLVYFVFVGTLIVLVALPKCRASVVSTLFIFPLIAVYCAAHMIILFLFQVPNTPWVDTSETRWLGFSYRDEMLSWDMWPFWSSYAAVILLFVALSPVFTCSTRWAKDIKFFPNVTKKQRLWVKRFGIRYGWGLCTVMLGIVSIAVYGIIPWVSLVVMAIGAILPWNWAAKSSLPSLFYWLLYVFGQYIYNIPFPKFLAVLGSPKQEVLEDWGFWIWDSQVVGGYLLLQVSLVIFMSLYVHAFLSIPYDRLVRILDKQSATSLNSGEGAAETNSVVAEQPPAFLIKLKRSFQKLPAKLFDLLLEYSYILSLIVLYFVCLTGATVFNAVYMIFFVIFIVSPAAAYHGWIALVLYSVFVPLLLYIWQINWTEGVISENAAEIIGLVHFEQLDPAEDLWVGLGIPFLIALVVMIQHGVLLFKKTQVKEIEEKAEEPLIPPIIWSLLFFSLKESFLLVCCVIFFFVGICIPFSVVSLTYVFIALVCCLLYMHFKHADAILLRLWVVFVIVSAVFFSGIYVYQFEPVSTWLYDTWESSWMAEYMTLEEFGLVFYEDNLFVNLLPFVVVLVAAVLQLRIFWMPSTPVDWDDKHAITAESIYNWICRAVYLYSPVLTFSVTSLAVLYFDTSVAHFLLFSVLLIGLYWVDYVIHVLFWLVAIFILLIMGCHFSFCADLYYESGDIVDWLGLKRVDTFPVPSNSMFSLIEEYIYVGVVVLIQRWSCLWTMKKENRIQSNQKIPKRYLYFLFDVDFEYVPLDDRHFSLKKIKWFLSSWASCCAYQIAFAVLCVALYYRAVTILGIFYLGVIVLSVQLPRHLNNRSVGTILALVVFFTIYSYGFVVGLPEEYAVYWDLKEEISIWILLETPSPTVLFVDVVVVFVLCQIKQLPTSEALPSQYTDLYVFLRTPPGSHFPSPPRTFFDFLRYAVFRCSALVVLLAMFLVGTASEDLISFIYLAFSLYLLMFGDFLFQEKMKLWDFARFTTVFLIFSQLIFQLTHAAIDQIHDTASITLQQVGAVLGLGWIDSSLTGIEALTNQLVILGLLCYQHVLVSDFRDELHIVATYVEGGAARAFNKAKALAVIEAHDRINDIKQMFAEKITRRERVAALKRARITLYKEAQEVKDKLIELETHTEEERHQIEEEEYKKEVAEMKAKEKEKQTSAAEEKEKLKKKEEERQIQQLANKAKDWSTKAIEWKWKAETNGIKFVDWLISTLQEPMPDQQRIDLAMEDLGFQEKESDAEESVLDEISALAAGDESVSLARMIIDSDLAADTLEELVKEHEQRRIVRLGAALFYQASRASKYICYFAMALNHFVYANLLSLVFLISAFAYAILHRAPRPWKTFWNFVELYTTVIICLKFLFQIPGFCTCHAYECDIWYFNVDSILNPSDDGFCPATDPTCSYGESTYSWLFSPPYFFGIIFVDGAFFWGCVFDMFVILTILFHKMQMSARGTWQAPMLQLTFDLKHRVEQFLHKQEKKFSQMHYSLKLSKYVVLGDESSSEDEFNSASMRPTEPTPSSSATTEPKFEDSSESSIAFVDDNTQKDKEVAKKGVAKLWYNIKHSKQILYLRREFDILLHDSTKIGKDLYTPLFVIDLLCFAWLVLFQSAFTGESGGFIDFLLENYVPLAWVIILIAQFTIILVDRVIWVKQSLVAKLLLQYFTLLLYSAALFWYLPYLNNKPFSEVPSLMAMFILKCFYWAFSGLQIAYGYPVLNSDRLLMRSFQAIPYLIFVGYRAIPFGYELRTIIDWALLPTTLNYYNYFKVEDIYAELYIDKCRVISEENTGRGLGQPRSLMERLKMGTGWIVMICAIMWFPLLLLSSGSPTNYTPLVSSSTIDISIKGWTPFYSQVQYSGITEITGSAFSDLREGRTFIEKDDSDRTQQALLIPYTSQYWDITEPSRAGLISALNDSETTAVELYTYLYLTRPSDENGEMPFEYTASISSKEASQLYSVLVNGEGSASLTNWFPRFLRLPSTDGDIEILGEEYINITVTLVDGIYWTLNQLQDDEFTEEEVQLYFLCYPIPSGLTESIASMGIISLYVTVVLALATMIRGTISGLSHTVMFENLPYCDDLLQLCKDIMLARQDGDLILEEQLCNELFQLYRSPALLIEKTKLPPGYKPIKPVKTE
ncbi:piezo-type mechanosensitive ion channel component 2 [Pelomyxa schiedti]|nr:piezo-type mechanosensitive ion channel component 2 [Pelomyxa schiedti]